MRWWHRIQIERQKPNLHELIKLMKKIKKKKISNKCILWIQYIINILFQTIFHLGRTMSVPKNCMNRAKPSFNHKSFHHLGDTKLPNHMWDTSWTITSTIYCSADWEVFSGSYKSLDSRYVIRPLYIINWDNQLFIKIK